MNRSQTTKGLSLLTRFKQDVRESLTGDTLYSQAVGDSSQLQQNQTMTSKAYRYMLLCFTGILVPFIFHYFYSADPVVGWAGVLLLAVFVASIWKLNKTQRPLAEPAILVSLVLSLVFFSVSRGQTYSLYWCYPLLVVIPVLLSSNWAVVLGVINACFVLPVVLTRFELSAGFTIFFSMVLTWLVSAWLMYVVKEQSRYLTRVAVTDSLTGAYNRRYFELQVQDALEMWGRYRRSATLLLIDVDFFKRVNDKYGHSKGDEALKTVVRLITARARSVDAVCRFGGEEFVVMLRETGIDNGMKFAEDIRAMVEASGILPEGTLTISIGVCEVKDVVDADHWLNITDAALYRAKHNGRNRVERASVEIVGLEPKAKTVPEWR
ncbi:MAG: GGDEF domain-containing protein [Halieaceae bacterium]|jgi:diguanylate cyclase|nr:GGDEF domain-containing protein [Halieaceae bacterium]